MDSKRKRSTSHSTDEDVPKKSIQAVIGCKSGILKGVCFNNDKIEVDNHNMGDPSSNNKVVSMFYGAQEKTITIGYSDQFVRTLHLESKEFVHSAKYPIKPFNFSNKLVGVVKHKGKLVTAYNNGVISIWQDKNPISIKTTPNKISTDSRIKSSNLLFIKKHYDSDIIASGGVENDLALYNLTKPQTPMFKAKNVKADMLDLRVPIHVVDAAFCNSPSVIATCNNHSDTASYVRLYDTRAQNKPKVNLELKDPLSKIIVNPHNENEVLVGFSKGRMSKFDLRRPNPRKEHVVYKGFLGGVKDMAVHPTEPIVFVVSLDRYFRAYDLQSGALLFDYYTNSIPSTLLLTDAISNSSDELFQKQRKSPAVRYKNLYKHPRSK